MGAASSGCNARPSPTRTQSGLRSGLSQSIHPYALHASGSKTLLTVSAIAEFCVHPYG